MNSIIIDGKRITVQGNNISIVNGQISIDGKTIDDNLSGEVHIIWEGDLANLTTDGSVTCNDVHGNVSSGGSANIGGNVGGNIFSGGSANITGNVSGSVSAGGSINYRK
jgi:hypothetical protein